MIRVLAVADSDPNLEWGEGLLGGARDRIDHYSVVLRGPDPPTRAQIRSAAGRVVPVVGAHRLLALVGELEPDAVLLACSSGVVGALLDYPALRGPARPVLIAGAPGIAYPVGPTKLRAMAGIDLLIVHSRTERAAYRRLLVDDTEFADQATQIGLATLPALAGAEVRRGRQALVVFAAQDAVPATARQRRAILDALAAVPPEYMPVIQAGIPGRRRGSGAPAAYADLEPHPRIEFRHGGAAETLDHAAGCATISGTVALQALARGIPVLALDDFGIGPALGNEVFEDSGLFGGLGDLREARFRSPVRDWLLANYFQPAAEADWLARLDGLVARRNSGALGAATPGQVAPRARVARQLRLRLPGISRYADAARGRRPAN
ncbi:hypothetical protein GGQ54_000251 [Naumannella cuiyingiana]|uniref:Uncharacterized protein n=1 Tax=Naumannella cuiyingiana TaxID=1347891 RepID=A0A7Z0D6K0_9ACTN|nr:DUF6716 putative glycosyltransferase [Naumannella cuiyingiana]NYI69691.1 hypothetical protein [Naumannella cuiyingiana]